MGLTRVLAAAAILSMAVGPAGAGAFFAAGFSGGFERSVALAADDTIVACRAIGGVGGGRALGLERWRSDDSVRLWLQSDVQFDIHAGPFDLVADGETYALSPGPDATSAFVKRLSPEAETALASAGAASLDAHGYSVALPAGVAEALRFVNRCRG